MDLLRAGEVRPTAQLIAEHAQVSVRSVFQHYQDMEALYASLVDSQSRYLVPLLELRSDGDLNERLGALVTQRAGLFEAIAPVRRSLGPRQLESAAVQRQLRALSKELRAQVERQFAPELATSDPATRTTDVDALDAAASYDTWRHLREQAELSRDRAADTLSLMLGRLLPD